MIARLRELADRPIADDERRRLFAAMALLIVVAAVLLSVAGDPTGPERATERTPAPPSVAQPSPSRPDQDGLEGSEQPPRAAPEQVERAARRFLNGYLAYLYGHGDAESIRAASKALARHLRREAPRVSPATRRREPRVADLAVRRLDADRHQVTATVADGGVAAYPIELTVGRRFGDWVVTSTTVD